MRLGCFGKVYQLEAIEQAGFDCAELDFCEIAGMSGDRFDELCKRVESVNLTFEVFSGLLPLDVRIYDRNFDQPRWLEHIRTGAERVSALGARMIPFGAGKCRSIPEDCEDPGPYEERLRCFVKEICGILNDYGICLVMEPLGPANSNYLNRIEEACEFAEGVNLSNCGIMCDLRHMVKNQEPVSQITRFGKKILHAHIDDPNGEYRRFPRRGDGFDYKPFIQTLCEAGYRGILTVEATSYRDFSEEAKACVMYLRELI